MTHGETYAIMILLHDYGIDIENCKSNSKIIKQLKI